MKAKYLRIILFLVFSHSSFAQITIEPMAGIDWSMLTSGSSNYGWELLGLYPFVGLQTEHFLLSAFGGGGISVNLNPDCYLTYSFGGNIDFFFSDFLIGAGGGMAGAKTATGEMNFEKPYPFVRGTIGGVVYRMVDDGISALKLSYDYNFGDNGYKISILFSSGFSLDTWTLGKKPSYPPSPPRPAPVPPPPEPDPPPPPFRPARYPTLTPEELRKVELAYEATVRDLERQGKRLYIRNASERAAFIRQYQGIPDTASVSRTKNLKLPFYSTSKTSEQAIVALAREETDYFRRVRMIHDWVADIFAYDYDLLWWMDNVSGRNEEFTLWAILERERGVCLEYAILFCFLMNASGVDTYLISDRSKPGIGHAYNMVVINNTGYIIDTTWDSGNWYKNGRIRQFDRMNSTEYFMPGIAESYRLRRWN